MQTITGNFYTLCANAKGGWCVFRHGGVATDFNDYAEALAEFNRLEAIEAKSYAQFAQGA